MAFFFLAGMTLRAADALSDAEVQGGALAQKILEQRPEASSTNTGTLQVRRSEGRVEIPVTVVTSVTATNWQMTYSAPAASNSVNGGSTSYRQITIVHAEGQANRYLGEAKGGSVALTAGDLFAPFAGSDYWVGDLGLEFFHWPAQKVVKKEFHRNCPCTVLESTNPHPSPDGYARVECWIDNDSLGIVEAYAYDSRGRRLKNFYPKNLEKVNGQYQVESMIMENLLTDSRSRLEFDLKK